MSNGPSKSKQAAQEAAEEAVKRAEDRKERQAQAAQSAADAEAHRPIVDATGDPIAASTEPAPVGGPDAPRPKTVDESTTRVPKAVGLPDVKQARRELAENPARTAVLSKDGHLVREL